MTERVFLLGLDGVPWSLLSTWVDEGALPNFGRLFETGAAGPLRSTTPATTPAAWPSIATGVGPDKHGVYAFHRPTRDYRQRMNTRRQIRRPALWDMLTPAAVGNVPMTYPAPDVDGRMVTGMLSPGLTRSATSPPELAAEIRERVPDYGFGLDWNDYHDRPDAFRSELDALVAARRSVMRFVDDDEWRLFFFVYVAPDRLQHLRWDREVLLDHYRRLDEIVGEAMDRAAAADATLFVVSDHGFGPTDRAVAVNQVLERAGLLAPKSVGGLRGVFDRVGLTKERVLGALDRVGVDPSALTRLPAGVVDAAADRIPGDHRLYDVDFSGTVAFSHGPGNVYVNDAARFVDGPVAPGDRRAVARRVRALLAAVRDPETGERVLEVHDGAELFPADDRAPDLVVEGRPGYRVRNDVSGPPVGPADRAADHRPTGVLLAVGPDVAAGARPAGASVVDVAPTVLHAAGEPVPADVDGDVLAEVFAEGSPTRERPVETRAYHDPDDAVDEVDESGEGADEREEDFDGVEDRLRGLGYME